MMNLDSFRPKSRLVDDACLILCTDFTIKLIVKFFTYIAITAGAASDALNVENSMKMLKGGPLEFLADDNVILTLKILSFTSHVFTNYLGRTKPLIERLRSPNCCAVNISSALLSAEDQQRLEGVKTPGLLHLFRLLMGLFVTGSAICLFMARLSGGTVVTEAITKIYDNLSSNISPDMNMTASMMNSTSTPPLSTISMSLGMNYTSMAEPTTMATKMHYPIPNEVSWAPYVFALGGLFVFFFNQALVSIANSEQYALFSHAKWLEQKQIAKEKGKKTLIREKAVNALYGIRGLIEFFVPIGLFPAILPTWLTVYAITLCKGIKKANKYLRKQFSSDAFGHRFGMITVIVMLLDTVARGAFTIAGSLFEVDWARDYFCEGLTDKACKSYLFMPGIGSQIPNFGMTWIGRGAMVYSVARSLLPAKNANNNTNPSNNPPSVNADQNPPAEPNEPAKSFSWKKAGFGFCVSVFFIGFQLFVSEVIQGLGSIYTFLQKLHLDGSEIFKDESKAAWGYQTGYLFIFALFMFVRLLIAYIFTNKVAYQQTKVSYGFQDGFVTMEDAWLVEHSKKAWEQAKLAQDRYNNPDYRMESGEATDRTPLLGAGTPAQSYAGTTIVRDDHATHHVDIDDDTSPEEFYMQRMVASQRFTNGGY